MGNVSMAYVLYLTNRVKFHVCEWFHIFDEADFMSELYEFYKEPSEKLETSKMWYIRFLLILAFGKSFLDRPTKSTIPSSGRG